MQMNRIIRFDPNFLPSSQCGRLSVVCDEGTADQCCQGNGTTSYFENTVAGKITEPRVAFFWANFIMYRGRPKCIDR